MKQEELCRREVKTLTKQYLAHTHLRHRSQMVDDHDVSNHASSLLPTSKQSFQHYVSVYQTPACWQIDEHTNKDLYIQNIDWKQTRPYQECIPIAGALIQSAFASFKYALPRTCTLTCKNVLMHFAIFHD